jgi:RES domain-containing protein
VWRAVVGQTNPLRPNQRGARWNPADEEALYCSLTESCARAELAHVLSKQYPPVTKERKVYRMEIGLQRVLDLSDRSVLALFADGDDLFGDNQLPAQRIGRAVVVLECAAILVPSARCEGSNLVLYTNRLDVKAGDYYELLDPYSII